MAHDKRCLEHVRHDLSTFVAEVVAIQPQCLQVGEEGQRFGEVTKVVCGPANVGEPWFLSFEKGGGRNLSSVQSRTSKLSKTMSLNMFTITIHFWMTCVLWSTSVNP